MQNSKTRIASLALGAVVCLMAFSSCLKYGDDTIVLPQPTGKIPPSVIPTDLQDSLIHHDFPIHEGVEPPDVEPPDDVPPPATLVVAPLALAM